ncbi:MAG TPA: universal stress protein [Nitrospiria bacterium]|nr:universal stress protein [Nitrospiria bacterium]
METKTILIPTDFSELSKNAVDIGIAIADALSARVILLHSINMPDDMDELSAAYNDYYAYVRDQASGGLEELMREIEAQGIKTKMELVWGIPHEEIVKIARSEKVDMIVMGTHGRTGWDRLLMGSQAEHVVRTAPCPVITVKGALQNVKEEVGV